MRNPSYLIVGLALLSLSLLGCKPAQPENEVEHTVARSSQPQHFKKTCGEPENFNRDIHVLRTLWEELSTLDPANEDEKEKYNLLLDALQERVVSIEPIVSDFTASDQTLVEEIRLYLNTKAHQPKPLSFGEPKQEQGATLIIDPA